MGLGWTWLERLPGVINKYSIDGNLGERANKIVPDGSIYSGVLKTFNIWGYKIKFLRS